MTRTVAAVAFVQLLSATGALAQAPGPAERWPATSASAAADSSVRAFLREARRATARYRDRGVAITDGYRLLGPDFPGMGEHWVQPGHVVEEGFDAARPEVLSYVDIGGEPRLAGVAYAVVLGADEPPPDFPPGRPWHDHSRTIDEESVLLHQVHATRAGGSQLAMLHAWIWLDNPAGTFVSDNWALPYVRLDMSVPDVLLPEAAMALSLTSGGDAYYLRLVRAVAKPGSGDVGTARAVLRRYRARVEALVTGRSGPRGPEPGHLADLWREMWSEIEAAVGTATAAELRRMRTGALSGPVRVRGSTGHELPDRPS